MVGFIKKLVYSNLSPNKSFYSNLYQLLGYFPANISLYKQALIHNSTTTQIEGIKTKKNNERLEYLGDAVLDSIIAEYLFKKFPFQGEGFLTEMRAKAVSRKRLSQIALDIGLHEYLIFDKAIKRNRTALRGIAGNALEAVIGAVYLDKGYKFTKRFVHKRIILPHLDFDNLKNTTENFKSLLNQHSQKTRKPLEFVVLENNESNPQKMYTIGVMLEGTEIAKARGKSKKVAEQLASEKACTILELV